MFIFKKLALVFVIYAQLEYLAANILSVNEKHIVIFRRSSTEDGSVAKINDRFRLEVVAPSKPRLHSIDEHYDALKKDGPVEKINERFRLEVIAPFKSSIDSYNELFKAIWELVKNLKDSNSLILPKIEAKHKKLSINFVGKLKQTSASSTALLTYITDLRQEISKTLVSVKVSQEQHEYLLKTAEANIVKFRNQVAVYNKKIINKQSELSSSRSKLRELQAKGIEPEWWCFLALAWVGVCMYAEEQKKIKQKHNNIKELESELSIMQNGLSRVENSRDRLNSQISGTKNSIGTIENLKSNVQKYNEELNLRKDASVKIVEKLRSVVKKVHQIEAPGQQTVKTLEEQGEYMLASEDLMIQMEEIAQYITMFKSGSGENFELAVTKEQMKKIRDMLAKSKKNST